MRGFKVGDKVRFIRNVSGIYNTIGYVGVVTMATTSGYFIVCDNPAHGNPLAESGGWWAYGTSLVLDQDGLDLILEKL